MKKWVKLGEALTSDGNRMELWERDDDYTIRVNGNDLMSTRQRYSEEKLGELGCAHLSRKPKARVLIGGLGLGFTLKAVLSRVPSDAEVIVVELMPQIIEWNRNGSFPFAAEALQDPRVKTLQGDVVKFILEDKGGFDAILLDIDNGPAALTTAGNKLLYEESCLKKIRLTLRPEGCLAVWSVSEAPDFSDRLQRTGFKTTVEHVRAHSTSGARRTIFLAYRS